jgi:hypothetical protein
VKEAEARQRLEEYIDELHAILWLDWEIAKPARRQEAVDWMINLWVQIGLVERETR